MEGPDKAQVLQLAAVLLLLFARAVQGITVTYDWTVDYSWQAPDCVEKLVIAVNGQYPGPQIRATAGDCVIVNVYNALPTEGIAIHWHGILQAGTPWADGTAFVSQCPIGPGETYSYNFTVTNAGTYHYHGHDGMQRMAGFYGSLIVDLPAGQSEPFTYDGELSILLNDWWHRSMYEQELGLFTTPFRWVGEPQTLLIEGRGAYNCSKVPAGAVSGSGDCVTCNASSPLCAPYVLPVETGKTYRLRIASVASLSSLNFVLEGHSMTVVEADGHYVQPVVVQNLDIYSGETYSVIFTASQDSSRNYWAGVNVRGRMPATPTGLAVLNYKNNPSTSLPTTPPPVSPRWDDFDLSMANAQVYEVLDTSQNPPSRTADRQLLLLNTQNFLGGKLKWAVNNVTYEQTETPVLVALKYSITGELVPQPPDTYTAGYNISAPPSNPNTTAGSGVYTFKLNDIVDVILQNANTLTMNNSEIHPWHLHGHDFWVLGYGKGVFNSSTDYAQLNFDTPPKMNTVAVFPYGWTVLRFVADNPGAWPFHCHIEPHFQMGMEVIFAEGVDNLPAIPAQNLGCGLTKKLIQ
ncbi:unnamed protein product [Calypogeia fissa]